MAVEDVEQYGTHMHDRTPAAKVILPRIIAVSKKLAHNTRRRQNSQVRVNARDARVLQRCGKMPQPPLGLPLERIVAPDGLVRVARL